MINKYHKANRNPLLPENILIISFTNTAVREIRLRLKTDAILSEYSDSFIIQTVDKFVKDNNLIGFKNSKSTFDEKIKIALSNINNSFSSNQRIYELEKIHHIIVDEVQDLVYPRANLIYSIIKYGVEKSEFEYFGMSLAGDLKQSLYSNNVYYLRDEDNWLSYDFINNIEELLEYNDKQLKKIVFTKSHRFSKNYHHLLVNYLNDTAIVDYNNHEGTELYFKDLKQIITNIIPKIKIKNINKLGSNVAILSRENQQNLIIADILNSINIDRIQNGLQIMQFYVRPKDLEPIFYPWVHTFFEEPIMKLTSNKVNLIANIFPGDKSKFRLFLDELKDEENLVAIKDLKEKIKLIKDDLSSPWFNLFIYKNSTPVIISTIHGVKGMEFEYTVLNSHFDKLFNKNLDLNQILYVALSRSKSITYYCQDISEFSNLKKLNYLPRDRTRYYSKNYPKVIQIHHSNDLDTDYYMKSSLESKDDYKLRIKFILSIAEGEPLYLLKSKYLDNEGYYFYSYYDNTYPIARLKQSVVKIILDEIGNFNKYTGIYVLTPYAEFGYGGKVNINVKLMGLLHKS